MSDLHKGLTVSPSAQRLAARYGVDPEKMEQIISGAVRESVPTFEPAVIHTDPIASGLSSVDEQAAPVVQRPTALQTDPEWLKDHTFTEEVRAEQLAATTSTEAATQAATTAAVAAATAAAAVIAADAVAKETSVARSAETPAPPRKVFSDIDTEPSNTNRVTIQSPSTYEKKEYREERKGLSPLAVILGVLGILAVIGIFWWLSHPRHHKTQTSTKQADSVAVALAAQRVSDSMHRADSLAQLRQDSLAMAEAPPVSTEKPVENAPAKAQNRVNSKPRAKAVRAVKRATSSSAAYTTSSGLSAQEHLADLRANGNHTAWVEAVNKNGSVVYKLHLTKQPALKKRKR